MHRLRRSPIHDGSTRPDPRDVDLQTHEATIEALITTHEGALMPIAQAVQARFGFMPRNLLYLLCRRLGLPVSRAIGVLSFYSGFHLEPRGRSVVKVCTGTACHQRGARRVVERLATALDLPPGGGTTPSLSHTLETVACVGCCSLAPVVQVGAVVHASVSPQTAKALLAPGEPA